MTLTFIPHNSKIQTSIKIYTQGSLHLARARVLFVSDKAITQLLLPNCGAKFNDAGNIDQMLFFRTSCHTPGLIFAIITNRHIYSGFLDQFQKSVWVTLLDPLAKIIFILGFIFLDLMCTMYLTPQLKRPHRSTTGPIMPIFELIQSLGNMCILRLTLQVKIGSGSMTI